MIHYQLRCPQAHEFDGWFKSSAGFEIQAGQGLISCPVCGATKVERALMAPGLARKGREPVAPEQAAPPATPAPAAAAGGVMPDAVRGMLTKLRTEIEKNCDYVGPKFAEEARKIHNGEAEPRGIYGETSPAEAEALADDGIEIASIPWLPRADS
jgi:hypothetical protein